MRIARAILPPAGTVLLSTWNCWLKILMQFLLIVGKMFLN
jgi:hypothetical protein